MRPTFIGQYSHSLDPKNRLFIPPRFRAELQKEDKAHFVLTVGMDGCLRMLLPSEWDGLQEKLNALQLKDNGERRAVLRRILSQACEAEVDTQGRILLPQNLKEQAGLRRDVVIIGVGSQIELWDRQRYTAYERKARKIMEKASPDLPI